MDFKFGSRGFIYLQKNITHKLFICMKRDYPEEFQRIFKKYKNLILRVGGGGNLKNMDFSKIIFPRFCRYKRRMQLLFKLLFDISHHSRRIPRKGIF